MEWTAVHRVNTVRLRVGSSVSVLHRRVVLLHTVDLFRLHSAGSGGVVSGFRLSRSELGRVWTDHLALARGVDVSARRTTVGHGFDESRDRSSLTVLARFVLVGSRFLGYPAGFDGRADRAAYHRVFPRFAFMGTRVSSVRRPRGL